MWKRGKVYRRGAVHESMMMPAQFAARALHRWWTVRSNERVRTRLTGELTSPSIAPTAGVSGKVNLGAGSSVWY